MKLITLLGTAAVLSTSAQAAELISGWNFSNYFTSGESWTIQGGFLNETDTVYSLFSDTSGDGFGNTNGSVTALGGAAGNTVAGAQNLTTGVAIATRPVGPDFSTFPTGANTVNFAMRVQDNGQLLFVTDTDGLAFDFTDSLSLFQYAASTTVGTASISWEYSFNGTDFLSTGDTHNITDSQGSGGELFGVNIADFGSAYNGDLYVRADISGLSSNFVLVDNVQFVGQQVPEPSTYAAIAGAAVLALVVVRRRRKA